MWCSITYTPPPPCDKKVVPKRILSIAFGLFRLYLDYVDYIWIVLIVCRPTALYRRQAGVQECIKGYTWLVWSKVELCRVQIAHQSCWLSWNCVDHRDFAKHQTCLIPFDILLILEKRAMPYFHTSDTDTIVGPDPPNPMVNWYSWHKVGAKGGSGPAERLNAYFSMKLVAHKGTITQTPPFVPTLCQEYQLTIGLGGSGPTITSVSDRGGLWPCTGSDSTYPRVCFLISLFSN